MTIIAPLSNSSSFLSSSEAFSGDNVKISDNLSKSVSVLLSEAFLGNPRPSKSGSDIRVVSLVRPVSYHHSVDNISITSSPDLLSGSNSMDNLFNFCKDVSPKAAQSFLKSLKKVKQQHAEEKIQIGAAHQEEINTLKKEVESNKAAHQEELKRIEESHIRELTETKVAHQEEVKKLLLEIEMDKAAHQEELKKTEENRIRELTEAKVAHQEEVKKLLLEIEMNKAAHQEELKKLQLENEQENLKNLKVIKDNHQREVKALNEKLDVAQTIAVKAIESRRLPLVDAS